MAATRSSTSLAYCRVPTLGASVGQHAADGDTLGLEERQHAVVQHVGGGDQCLGVVKLGEANLRASASGAPHAAAIPAQTISATLPGSACGSLTMGGSSASLSWWMQ